MTDTTFLIPAFGGSLLHPDDTGYDDARRVFNGMIDRRPRVIARCTSTADVASAVAAARANGVPLSVYGGGHSVTGSAVIDGGLCIDLRGLDDITVDPATSTARVGGGATWGQLDAATAAHGLAVTGGRVSGTGVGGLTLGSGSGWLERKLGFSCDNLLRATVVTADGRVVTASEDENPDLFWGIRGGGGNFGIVTEFTFALHPIEPLMLAGLLMYPAPMASDVLTHYREFMATAPDEVGGGVAFISAPPLDFVPEPVRGQPVVGVIVVYCGPVEEGRSVLEPLLTFGPPAITMVEPMPYPAVQQLIDPANPSGMRNYWSGDFLAEMPDAAVKTLVELGTAPISPMTQIIVVPGGGALARVDPGKTAIDERSAEWNIHYLSMWADPADDAANIGYTREFVEAMKPWTTGRVYLNFIGDEGTDRVADSYGTDTYQRMRQLKRTWDPDNVFRHNQNIPPAEA